MAVRDVAVPIVFPDFLITVATPPLRVDVPDFLPGIPDEVTVPATRNRVPYLGHAGIFFFNGRTGLTKYFEYGRYDPAARGLVRRHSIPDVRIASGGRPTGVTLQAALARIALLAGQGGRIVAAYIELDPPAFDRMHTRAQSRLAANTRPGRASYDLFTNSCLHFMKEVADAGGAGMPAVRDPRPAGYIDRVRASFPDLDFRRPNALAVQGLTFP
jgi:hypothetical protein